MVCQTSTMEMVAMKMTRMIWKSPFFLYRIGYNCNGMRLWDLLQCEYVSTFGSQYIYIYIYIYCWSYKYLYWITCCLLVVATNTKDLKRIPIRQMWQRFQSFVADAQQNIRQILLQCRYIVPVLGVIGRRTSTKRNSCVACVGGVFLYFSPAEKSDDLGQRYISISWILLYFILDLDLLTMGRQS